MKKIKFHEVVKTYELEPIATPSGAGESYKFRIEILRESGSRTVFHARVFRHETYRIQPTFPQKNRMPRREAWDHEIIVLDDQFESQDFRGKNAEVVLEKVMKRIQEIFGLP